MKKIILLVLVLINLGFGSLISNAQIRVVEFGVAHDYMFQKGGLMHRCLCVLNGDYGKLKFLTVNNDQCVYDAAVYHHSEPEGVTIVLVNPSTDDDYYPWPSSAQIHLSSTDDEYYSYVQHNVSDDSYEERRDKIRYMSIIPEEDWNHKFEQFNMPYECRSIAYSSSNSYSNSSSGSYNSNSYNSNNSNTYNSSSSDSDNNKIIDVAAGLAAGYVFYKVLDWIFDDSSDNKSSTSSSNNRTSTSSSNNRTSTSSSNNNTSSSNTENVMSKGNVVIAQTDLYQHNVLANKEDNCVLYLRNDNNHDVFVEVEMKVNGTWKKCHITYDNAPTEPINGSYSDNRSTQIHLKRNSSRVVEVTSYSFKRPTGIRITRVF